MVEVATRTLQGRLLLKPSHELTDIIPHTLVAAIVCVVRSGRSLVDLGLF
jgi:hypothetical protein